MDQIQVPQRSFTPQPSKQNFFKRYRKVFYIAIPILLILGFSIYVWFFGNKKDDTGTALVTPTPTVVISRSLYNGLAVDPALTNRRAVAAMIENSPDARPQSGLINADIVYEAVTEGGITRFMGIFSSNQPTKAGPIRSARSYFIDWLSEYDPFYVHAGGSPTALPKISQYNILDYPDNSSSYWREPRAGVATEHTLFSDISKDYKNALLKYKVSETVDFKPWIFKADSSIPKNSVAVSSTPTAGATASVAATKINVNFSTSLYAVIWNYKADNNTYLRSLAGSAHNDAVSKEQISASTIVVIKVPHSSNPPYADNGHESEWTMTTIGSGDCQVVSDGLAPIKGTWKKPGRTDRTRFYDETGKEIELRAGKIWIEVIPQDGTVTAN